jgi:hypothetical protein
MRVFKYSKYGEYSDQSDSEHVIIQDNEGFNNIVIYNPIDSNSLCLVNRIILKKLHGTNRVRMYSCDRMNTSYDNYMNIGSLNIKPLLLDEKFFIDNQQCVMQIDNENILNQAQVDIIKEYFLIILPKGCVIMRFENTIKRLEMSLNFVQDTI